MAPYFLFILGITFVGIAKSNDIHHVDESLERLMKYYLERGFPSFPVLLKNEEEEKHPPSRTVVRLFYESMCPACRRFETTYVSDLISKLGEHIVILTYPYGKAATTTYYNGTVTFWCQHGEKECYGNKLHICSWIHLFEKDTHKHLQFNSCLMEFERSDNGSDDNAVDECAAKMNIPEDNINSLKECAKGIEGTRFLELMGRYSVVANYTSLPHVLIHNKQWTGEPKDLMKDVCAAFGNPPEACKALG